MIKLLRDTSENVDFSELIKLLDSDLYFRYGVIQENNNLYNKIDKIENFVVGYFDSLPVSCVCFKKIDNETIEIKRMFVKSDFRGQGISSLILKEIENWAIELGFLKSVLETGILQPEAIRFYLKSGYSKIDNFEPYIGNLNSVCMFKQLRIID